MSEKVSVCINSFENMCKYNINIGRNNQIVAYVEIATYAALTFMSIVSLFFKDRHSYAFIVPAIGLMRLY